MRHPILVSKDRDFIGILHQPDTNGYCFAHWSIETEDFFESTFYEGDFGDTVAWICCDNSYFVLAPWELL